MDTIDMIFAAFLGTAVLIVIFIVYFCIKNDETNDQKIKELGFDLDDVKAFLDATVWYEDDFIKSKSVRLQYQKWSKGEISLNAKPHSDSSGLATGMILGMSASNISHHTP